MGCLWLAVFPFAFSYSAVEAGVVQGAGIESALCHCGRVPRCWLLSGLRGLVRGVQSWRARVEAMAAGGVERDADMLSVPCTMRRCLCLGLRGEETLEVSQNRGGQAAGGVVER